MPAQAGTQALSPRLSASFLDSHFRGNDASSFLSGKTYPYEPPGPPVPHTVQHKFCLALRSRNIIITAVFI